jgi:hypothetical protein
MRWEPLVLQLTDWLIYVSTVFAFQFFWGEVYHLYERTSQQKGQTAFAIFSNGEFWVLGYAIFLFMHLNFLTFTTPDMLLSTAVYLAAGLILKIRLSGPSLRRFALLGLALGLGFLTKAVMLPLAGVFVAAAVLSGFRKTRIFPCALATVLAFCALAGPYVYELSNKLGRFSVGEAGSLNYAWHVDGIPLVHWQGEPPQLGIPKHPTREIFSSPLVYEFGTRAAATYPPWYDPTYWNEGLRPRFYLAGQLTAFKTSLSQYLRAFWSQAVLIAGVLVLLAIRQTTRTIFREFARVWYIWIPALAAFAMYGIVWVEGRYVSQFYVLFWAAVLTLVRLPDGKESRRLLRVVVAVIAILMSIRIAVNFVNDSIYRHRSAEIQMEIAEGLTAKGIVPGEKAAVIEAGLGEEWQELTRILIVAEISDPDDNKFWASNSVTRTQVCQVLAKTGANVLIATSVPQWAVTTDWERVGATPVYIFRLNP